jgi:hypothetical protein
MAKTKLLVVARRFWPICDDSSQRLLHWCASLVRAGVDVHVLTARWHASWPEYSLCRDVPVSRLLPGPNSNWNETHFQKNVVQWIGGRTQNFDCLYVDRSDGLLSTILQRASPWELPVYSRFSTNDSGVGLSNSQRVSLVAMADACRPCAKVVCPTIGSHRWLIGHGISESKIVRIEDPAWFSIDRSEESRSAASHALFETCSDFVIPGRTSILLHVGVSESKPLRNVIQSLCEFLDQGALLRAWIVGCGIPPQTLYDLTKSRGWHREILLFDPFDDLQELMRVADLAIVSNPKETLQFTVPTLAHAGVQSLVAGIQSISTVRWNCRRIRREAPWVDDRSRTLGRFREFTQAACATRPFER